MGEAAAGCSAALPSAAGVPTTQSAPMSAPPLPAARAPAVRHSMSGSSSRSPSISVSSFRYSGGRMSAASGGWLTSPGASSTAVEMASYADRTALRPYRCGDARGGQAQHASVVGAARAQPSCSLAPPFPHPPVHPSPGPPARARAIARAQPHPPHLQRGRQRLQQRGHVRGHVPLWLSLLQERGHTAAGRLLRRAAGGAGRQASGVGWEASKDAAGLQPHCVGAPQASGARPAAAEPAAAGARAACLHASVVVKQPLAQAGHHAAGRGGRAGRGPAA